MAEEKFFAAFPSRVAVGRACKGRKGRKPNIRSKPERKKLLLHYRKGPIYKR
jgi:hypothetical protein